MQDNQNGSALDKYTSRWHMKQTYKDLGMCLQIRTFYTH